MVCRKCHREVPEGRFCALCGADQDPAPKKRRALRRPNGTGTVYKLQGRRKRPWVAAKDKVIIGYYETRTAALEALNKLAGRNITERYNMTFAEVFTAWKEEHYKTITKSGIASYNRAYDVFGSLHDQKFRSLRTSDFQAVLDQHMGKKYSTVSKYKQLITQMSQWAIREEIATTDFAKYVRLPSNEKVEKEIFTDEDIKKLEQNKSETARIILMLLSTGMRIGELFSLPVANYHETYVVGGEKTEAGRNRVIPIRPEGRVHFSYFVQRATGPLLLSGFSGDKIASNFRKRDYYPLLAELGISKKSPHATRHTYTTRAVREKMQPEVLRLILGHANYKTTVEKYTHIPPEDLVAAVENNAVTNTLLTGSEDAKKETP